MRLKFKTRTPRQVEAMRRSGRILAEVLSAVAKEVKTGVTTEQLADVAAQELKARGGRPAFLGYQGFPDVICISVNDEVVHGIPGARRLADGDIVGLDFGVEYDGMITDGAITVGVGKVSQDATRLMRATEEALLAGIEQVRDGARVGDIGAAIEARLLKDKLGVVEDLIGHGVGEALHEEPGVPNFGRSGTGPQLVAGMTIAIEPMATLGTKEVTMGHDGWTISTADGSLAAHFEATVLVTETGAEVLTQR